MKANKLTLGLSVMALFTLANTVHAKQVKDTPGASTWVENISIKASPSLPVFVVESDGKEYIYSQSNEEKRIFHSVVSGSCRNSGYLFSAYARLYKNKEIGENMAYKNLYAGTNKNHKIFGDDISIDIQWKLDPSISTLALNACQKNMTNVKNSGKSFSEILSQDYKLIIDSGIYMGFSMNCKGLIGGEFGGEKIRFVMQPIEVQCKGFSEPVNIVAN